MEQKLMFFKKQAFKIKDLLKEQGLEVSLVTVQEILAKSYGFNNRHVALSDDRFHSSLNSIKEFNLVQSSPKIIERASSPLSELPGSLTKENQYQWNFYWSSGVTQHNQENNGSPFEQLKLEEGSVFFIQKKSNQGFENTLLKYVYDLKNHQFLRQDPVKTLMEFKNLPKFYKNFEVTALSSVEIEKLFEVAGDWQEERRLLRHKSCPVNILIKYSKHKEFYVRIVALFSETNRATLAIRALKDPDARVRRVYYKYLLTETETTIEELRALLIADPKGANLVRNFSIDGESVVNWPR